MRKWMLAGAVMLLIVLAGVVGFAYYTYQDARSLFAQDKALVDDAVKALETEDLGARKLHEAASSRLVTTKGLAWVSKSELDDQNERLTKALKDARTKYPPAKLAWRLGGDMTLALIDLQYSNDPKAVDTSIRRFEHLLFLADLPRNLQPQLARYQDAKSKQGFINMELEKSAIQLETKYGKSAGNLFDLSSRSVLAMYARKGIDVFPERSNKYVDQITELSEGAGLPAKLWRPFVAGLEKALPEEEMDRRFHNFEKGVGDYLAASSLGKGDSVASKKKEPLRADQTPLPAETIAAWRKAEFGVGWTAPGRFMPYRDLKETPQRGEMIGFFVGGSGQFNDLAQLPQPDQRFALEIRYRKDARLKSLRTYSNLHALYLNEISVSLDDLSSLAQLPGCEILVLEKASVNDDGLKEIAKCKQLRVLGIPGNRGVTSDGIRELAGLEKLQSLDLSDIRNLKAEWVDVVFHLKKHGELQSLYLNSLSLDDSDLTDIGSFGKLQDLEVSSNRLTDAAVKQLKPLKQMRWLSLRDNPITDAGLRELATLSKLERLDLGVTRITGSGLGDLAGLEQLRSLDLWSVPLDSKGARSLARLKHLRVLGLQNTPTTDDMLKDVAALADLQELDLWMAKQVTDAGVKHLGQLKFLKVLKIAYTDVGNPGLSVLAEMSTLEHLDLTATKVTDAGIFALSKLKSLKTLDLSLTSVSASSIPMLQKALPNTVITHVPKF